MFPHLLLAFGMWQFWRWTEDVTNGIRIIVVYGCVNIMTALIFLLWSVLSHAQSGWGWAMLGLALAAVIAIMTTGVIRGFAKPAR